MKNYRSFLGIKNETWQQAIARFERFRQAEMMDYFSSKDYSYRFADNRSYTLHSTQKVLESYITQFQEKYDINIPPQFVDLVSNHQPFSIGDNLFQIFGGDESEAILTLPQILTKYGYASFVEQIGSGMLKSLSGFYFFFGVSFPESDQMDFLYFSKAQNFGRMLFSPNNPSLILKKVLPSMFNGSIEKYTLDSLISNQIDRVVTNALTVKGYID